MASKLTQGHRTDLDEIGRAVQDFAQKGLGLKDLDTFMPGAMLRFDRSIAAMLSRWTVPQERQQTPLCILVVGLPGTGKSQAVKEYCMLEQETIENCPSIYKWRYTKSGGEHTFLRVNPAVHRTLLLDEFKGQLDSGTLNDIMDGNGLEMRQPGGTSLGLWYPDIVAIVSNYLPHTWPLGDWRKETMSVTSFARRLHWAQEYVFEDIPDDVKTEWWADNFKSPCHDNISDKLSEGHTLKTLQSGNGRQLAERWWTEAADPRYK